MADDLIVVQPVVPTVVVSAPGPQGPSGSQGSVFMCIHNRWHQPYGLSITI